MEILNQDDLRPGDVLLYAPSGCFGYAIAWLTSGWVSHVEIYAGYGRSWASRDGQGVAKYPFRYAQLKEVRRSVEPLNLDAMRIEFLRRAGDSYDYSTIVKFLSFGFLGGRSHAEVCSEFATMMLRMGGLRDLFGDAEPDEIAPRDFQKSGLLGLVWKA